MQKAGTRQVGLLCNSSWNLQCTSEPQNNLIRFNLFLCTKKKTIPPFPQSYYRHLLLCWDEGCCRTRPFDLISETIVEKQRKYRILCTVSAKLLSGVWRRNARERNAYWFIIITSLFTTVCVVKTLLYCYSAGIMATSAARPNPNAGRQRHNFWIWISVFEQISTTKPRATKHIWPTITLTQSLSAPFDFILSFL